MKRSEKIKEIEKEWGGGSITPFEWPADGREDVHFLLSEVKRLRNIIKEVVEDQRDQSIPLLKEALSDGEVG